MTILSKRVKTFYRWVTQSDKKMKTSEIGAMDMDWEGNPARQVSRDKTTKRKQMETALKNSEDKFAAAFRASPDIIAIADLKTGKLIEVNDSFTQATGYTREETIGQLASNIAIYAYPEDEAKMHRLLKEKDTYRFEEFNFRMKSGEIRQWLSSAEVFNIGNDQCIMAVSIDITERKRMEQKVIESEEKFSNVFQHNPEIILVTDVENSTLIDANDTFIRLAGGNRDEIIGKKVTDVVTWADPQARLDMIKTVKEKKTISNMEIIFSVGNGEFRTWLLSGEIVNIKGRLHILSVIIDITERKKMEQAMIDSEEKFSKAFRRSPEVILISTLNDGILLDVNDTFLRLSGYTRDEIIGKKTSSLGLWVDLGERTAMVNVLREKGTVSNLEYQFRMKSGEIRTWLFSAEIINISGQLHMLSVTTDITERKKMEDILRFSDFALKSIHEGVYAMDNDLKITYWNEMCELMFSVKASDAIGKTPIDCMKLIEVNKGQTEQRIDILMKEGFSRDEQIYRTPHGDIWVDAQVQAIEYSGKRYGWLTLLSDISARKKVEEELRQSETKYRELIDTSSDAIISADGNMAVTIWNKGAEKIFGYSEKEMMGQPVTKIVPDFMRPGMAEGHGTFTKTGASRIINQMLDLIAIGNGGRRIPIELSVSSRKDRDSFIATAIIRDITRRKEAELALKTSEEKYRELINTSNDAIVSIDTQMQFILWNSGAEKLLGYTEKEMLGQSLLTIFPEESRTDVARELVILKQTGTTKNINRPFETKLLKKDCSLLPVDMSISTRQSDDKLISTAIMRDITERKEAEEKMRQIDQMKQEFLSNVSHELRTPLQSISGFTKLIMNGEVPDAATQQEFLHIIDQETLSLGNLINSLLDMSRLESGKFQINRRPLAIRDTINESLKMFKSLARQKNIELIEKIDENIPEMNLDNDRIRQVIVNLVSNAVKFSDPGGSVKVTAEIRNNELIFQVADRGTGIRDENMKHLFERFYREEGEKVRGGTGLGLYISKQIIDAHGGHIWAESKAGEGSTFSFALPLIGKGLEAQRSQPTWIKKS